MTVSDAYTEYPESNNNNYYAAVLNKNIWLFFFDET